ncbi:hypothetical protein LPL18_011455 [Halomonas sp. CUBES01]|uniref:hypothetical protein n=1 Tax=Halomonas sp. CUBES01 TaxID=2897340 RepID=UPI001E414F7D|nr:hypothetical protein [Halomonas sp. CUBES01]MEC4767941.1 hypothetical protein [Halomonas sp. CUBES01]
MLNYAIIKDNRCIATGALNTLPDRPDLIERINGVPQVGDVLENGEWVTASVEPEPERPRVGPVEFKLLFTSAERLTLKELRNTDAALADFFEIIEDPRLQYVDLSLGSTAAGVDHCISLLINAEIIAESEADTRREQILSGTLL